MKYKRNKSGKSKYISHTSDKSKDKRKINLSLKQRSTIALILVIGLFGLTRLGVINRPAARNLIKKNGVFDSSVKYITDKLGFLGTSENKISDFVQNVLKDNKEVKTNAYAGYEQLSDSSAESSAEAALASDAAHKESEADVFSPTNPCAGRISSDFGERVHPLSSEVTFHNGIDIAAGQNDEIRACFSGTVEISSYNQSSGNYIIIRHDDEYTSSYAHMSKRLVNAGDKVKTGDIIGLVGSTGISTGPHLHFEIRKNGTPVNPKELIKNK